MMNYISSDLWKGIHDFEIGLSNASLSFTDRLARENGWDSRFAARVVEEYRRFCFLGMSAGHPVTPSEQVDQAWHLHLLYSENYWTEFCGEVLKRPFHHGPTRGGRQEGDKYHDWYQATLDSYERVFGDAPPADIWPDADARFRDAHLFQRINTASHWVIPKPSRAHLLRWLTPVIALPVLGACAAASDGGSSALWMYGGTAALLVFFVALRLGKKNAKGASRKSGRGTNKGTGCGVAGCGDTGYGHSHRSADKNCADGDQNDAGDCGGGDSGCGGGCSN